MSVSATSHKKLLAWVDDFATLAQPKDLHWCTGSAAEHDELCDLLVAQGTFTRLAGTKRPNSYWAHSDPRDVARVEERTFICAAKEDEAGPTNNWRDPDEMRATMTDLFRGAMHGRTMYVVPFSMGPLGSSMARIGVQLTDSAYVTTSMAIMTRMGAAALDVLGDDGEFVRCLHSVGVPLGDGDKDLQWPCDPANTYVAHFPECASWQKMLGASRRIGDGAR
jgi:phosphoenolpyruvate carboxykinase (GTP)